MKSVAQTLGLILAVGSASLAMAAAVPCGEYPLLEESYLGSTPTSYLHTTATRVGDLVYTAGFHSDFQIYDVSHPTQPAFVAEIDASFPHNLSDPVFVVAGDVGYVDGCDRVIPVFDLTEPAAPVEITRIPMPFDVTAVAVAGDRLYAASYGRRVFEGPDSTSFQVFDVADPENPVMLAEAWNNHWGWAHGMRVRDGVAYLGANNGLLTFDVSDPASVVPLGQVNVGWDISQMHFAGDLLVATAGPSLHVLDVSDPANPAVLGSVDTAARTALSLSVLGDLAVTAHRGAGLRVIDFSDPTQPTIRSVWASESSCYSAFLEADRVCVLKSDELMLAARDFPDPIETIGAVGLTYLTERTLLHGDLLYTAHVWELLIHDVSDPAAPVLLGKFEDGRAYYTLSLDGSVLYLAGAGSGGVVAIDVSDPSLPVKLSRLTLEQSSSVHAVDGRVVVGLRAGGVQLYDTGDPAAPVLLGALAIDPGVRTYGVHLEGDHIYTHSRWTRVIDAGDPTAMQVVASHLTGWSYDLAADGPWIYAPGDAITVLRFTPPATLDVVATQPHITDIQDMHLDGNLLYTAARQGCVYVFDVTDPAGIQRVGALPPNNECYGVSADAGRVAIVSRVGITGAQGIVDLWNAPCIATGVDDPAVPPAAALTLTAAPNPFNPRVTLAFRVPRAGRTELAVFDLRGRRVATIHEGHLEAGAQRFQWDGRDATGRAVASGAYLARLSVGDAVVSRSVMLAR